MNSLKRFASLGLVLLILIGIGGHFAVPIAHAQATVTEGLNTVGAATSLSGADPRVIIARIINIFLGLLAIIMVSIIVYAGFVWMTAGGDAAQVEKAKAYIRNAIIGLVIILSSWAITTFVISRLLQATGGGGGGATGTGPGGGGGGLGGGGGTGFSFQVRSITPSGSVSIRNVDVRFLFSSDVDASKVASAVTILKASDNSVVAGDLATNGTLVTFTPSAPCPSDATRKCFDADTDYIARVNTTLRSTTGQSLGCGGIAPACEARFHTGSLVDTANPVVIIQQPFDGQSVPVDDAIRLVTLATDDSGIGSVESFADARSIGRDGPLGNTSSSFSASVLWNTSGLATGTHALQSRANDIDSNSGQSSLINVVIRPQHCFNGQKDSDETALDCGGSSCGVCSGGTCKTGTDCSSGVCSSSGVCVDQPIILEITPADGRPGTFVTINGANFGANTGRVMIGGQVAQPPAACVNSGASSWSSRQIIVTVPNNAVSGAVTVSSTAGLSDASDDARGPKLNDFIVNNVARPGLCAANPSHGLPGVNVNLVGVGLGSTRGQVVMDTDRQVNSVTGWNDTQVSFNAPVFSPGSYETHIVSGATSSNSVLFTVDEKTVSGPPIIDGLEPSTSTVGGYVTITGRNFGDLPNRVIFRDPVQNAEGDADINFPPACSNNYWHDTSVVVKVPANLRSGLGSTIATKPGNLQITIVRQSDAIRSASANVSVVDGQPGPGVCAVEPIAGPIGTDVNLVGENFGSSVGTTFFKGAGSVDRVPSVAGFWSGTAASSSVPSGSASGKVTLRTTGGAVSNGVNFQVRNCNEDANMCGRSEVCCQDTGACSVGGSCPVHNLNATFAWQTSPGRIPINPEIVEECNQSSISSPSPWIGRSGGDKACRNADIMMRFTTHLDPVTISNTSITVRKCTGTGANPCSQASQISGSLSLATSSDDQDYVRFRPNQQLDANATYEVLLAKTISSDLKIPMLENASRCGAGNAYCFRFVTRDANCEPGSITVTPSPFTAKDIGEQVGYQGAARAAGDICIHINGASFNWNWHTLSDGGGPDTRASFIPPITQENATATALLETGRNPVNIVTEILTASRPTGTGALFINFVPPRVLEYGPNCSAACSNAALWAKFNVPMDVTKLGADSIEVRKCDNENCRNSTIIDLGGSPPRFSADPTDKTSRQNTYLLLEPVIRAACSATTVLQADTFYKVILKRSDFVSQSSQLPLANTNDPDGFAWVFRVKAGPDARCTAAAVDVAPGEKIETLIGARQFFDANPRSSGDTCNAKGQPLVSDHDYTWASTDQAVAKLVSGGSLALSKTLPAYCTNRCLAAGASGIVGKTANCGNSIIETTNGFLCRRPDASACRPGDTNCHVYYSPGRFGRACTVLAPGSIGAEECDLGAANGPNSSCSSKCLNNPVRRITDNPAGTCGNGVIEEGEQCDQGRLCIGGAFDGRTCTANSECGSGSCQVVERFGCSDQCQLEGSNQGFSACGNRDLGDGEACDDGNTLNGDGCSSICLDEGAAPVTALCGNGVLENGETCEKINGVWPTNCNQTTCLNTGTEACPAGATSPVACCGNGVQDPGEDTACDQGPGRIAEGCTAHCLKSGASISFSAPSVCGDGVIGIGEQCDVTAATGPTCGGGSRQLAEISGTRDPLPSETDNTMRSTIQAQYDDKTGSGIYGLRCGFTSEQQCIDQAQGDRSYGLTTGGCCTKRPFLVASNPTRNEDQVCRNALIFGTFDGTISATDLDQKVLLARRETATSCPTGTTPLAKAQAVEPGFWGWLSSVWHRVVAFFTGGPAYAADLWCVGRVSGSIKTEVITTPTGPQTTVSFVLDDALEANTDYRLVFRGDRNLSDATREGIQSTRGVVLDGDVIIDFKSSSKICGVDTVQIRDTNLEKPFLYTINPERHQIEAQVQATENGRLVPIVPVPEYAWAFEPWTSSSAEPDGVLRVASSVNDSTGTFSTSTIETFQNKNGSSIITSGVKITKDTINIPSTANAVIEGSKTATVLLCERPWPLVDTRYSDTTFADEKGSSFLTGNFSRGPFYQFSTLYCLDAGDKTKTADDLPMLTVNATQIIPNDKIRGVERQFLMSFADPSLAGDGIGIRVIRNPLHLSAQAWYSSQGFTGRPTALTVDGYDAIRDGTTVYVGAANADNNPTSGTVTSSIYLISVNPNAKPQTLTVFNQLLDNWTFNINFESDSRNVCVDATNSVFQSGGKSIACDADWVCDKYSTPTNPLRCSASKAKLRRDTKRIADFQGMMDSLESTKQSSGQYPKLTDGTFLQSMSNSLWSSWSNNLASQLGITLPKDPINRFMTCGRCRANSGLLGVCMSDSDCDKGQTCVAQVDTDPNSQNNGFDPATCWNATTRRYLCPKTSDYSNSHIYQYRNVDNGQRYELATELEFADSIRYSPRLIEEVRRCSNTNQICSADTDCSVYDPSSARIVSTGTCNGTGGHWIYGDVCGGRQYGIDDVCGNGIRGEREVCEVGDTRPTPCTAADGSAGTKLQVCNDCRGFADNASTVCVKNAACGNGRIDRYQCQNAAGTVPGYKYGQTCTTPTTGPSAECGDSRDAGLATGGATVDMRCIALQPAEVCDDGSLNGTYGHCNLTCSGTGAYCGDGLLSAGETCDNGLPSISTKPQNGDYCGQNCNLAQSCSIDCRNTAPHCGDSKVQLGNEQCDGNSDSTDKAICYFQSMSVDQTQLRACSVNSDCTAGGICPSDPSSANVMVPVQYQACTANTVKLCTKAGKVCPNRQTACSTDTDCGGAAGSCRNWNSLNCNADADCGSGGRCLAYPSQHTRACGQPAQTNSCQWNPWSACQAKNSCGDGVLNPGEDCDDGNLNDNDACTSQCKRNSCGDGFVNTGTEECDQGAQNGAACSAEYGSTCARCSTTCHLEASSGGFCGDGIKQPNSGEQCDKNDGVVGTTCRALGYDYASQIRCTHGAFWVAKEDLVFSNRTYAKGETIYCDPASEEYEVCLQEVQTFGDRVTYYPAATNVSDPSALIPSSLPGNCVSAPVEGLSCSNSCSFAGCKRCSDTPDAVDSGSISGTVFDAIYSTYPVPNARVTLYSNGVRVSEVFTDADGKFTFNNINKRAECQNYRIVIDSYQDNPCTGADADRPSCNNLSWVLPSTVNESQNGGYWPFESKTFSAPNNATFCDVGLENSTCKVFLVPRVAANETMAVALWNGNINRFLDAHLLAPVNPVYDIRWNTGGNPNHLLEPHGNLFCFHSDFVPKNPPIPNDPDMTTCGSFVQAPEVIKYTLNNAWANEGYYDFFIKNWSAGGAPLQDTNSYMRSVDFHVVVVTHDKIFTVRPQTQPVNSCAGNTWFVYQQAASDAIISVPNASAGNDQGGQFLCNTDALPNYPPHTVGDNQMIPD